MAWEAQAASAVVGLAGFELWKLWSTTAPSLSDMRANARDDIAIRQRLLDAEMTVGALSLVLGTAFSVLLGNGTPLIIMVMMFATFSFMYRWILAADVR